MNKMKVKVTGPIIRNADGCILKVSSVAYAKEPEKVYHVPDNAFWRALITVGRLVEVDPKPYVIPAKREKKEQQQKAESNG